MYTYVVHHLCPPTQSESQRLKVTQIMAQIPDGGYGVNAKQHKKQQKREMKESEVLGGGTVKLLSAYRAS